MNLNIIQTILKVKTTNYQLANIQKCGIKYFAPPPKHEEIEMPERPKLRFVEKVPYIQPGLRAPKMQKRLRLIRGPELVHNQLMHRKYGIVAVQGGRMKWQHFEVLRLHIGRTMDPKRMFAIWRIDAPWQPITKKGQGMRMGGGKGAIDHYVTPVKAGRIIIELVGQCEYKEVQPFLQSVAEKLPFKAKAISQKCLDEEIKNSEWIEKNNQNFFTMKYLIQNNMGGCQRWLSPNDLKYFGKYL